jgi:ABC-type polysaccharide/polyol phosphate export permease
MIFDLALRVLPMKPQYGRVRSDLVTGLTDWRMWSRLGWADVRRRYRRTLIGPFWTSISLSVFVVALAVVWSTLWHQELRTYLPFLCAGMVSWGLIATTITEGCQCFVAQEGLIKQVRFEFSMLAAAVVWRNLIVLAHNLVVYAAVALIFEPPIGWATLLVIPGLALVAINLTWLTLLSGLLTARFRDVQQLVNMGIQIALFVTPVFWGAQQFSGHRIVYEANPLFHLVDVVRSPLLGAAPSALSYTFLAVTALAGWALTFDVYSRFRRRLAYWL